MKSILSFALLFPLLLLSCRPGAVESAIDTEKEIYEWRIYSLADGDTTLLDDYFEDVLIPAYNRQGVGVGAFELYQPGETALRYLFFAYPDIETFRQVSRAVWDDPDFRRDAQPFFDTTAPDPVYTNFETYICEAFDSLPRMRKPGEERTLFEFRIYHSPNEEANLRKIKMFQEGEIAIFDEVGINSVCYGNVLAGPRMPALTYLTWYKDEPTRNAAWDGFRTHPEWLRMKALPEYAHTATNNTNRLLAPMSYSQY